MLVWGERFKYSRMRSWIDKDDIYAFIDVSAGNKSFVQHAWVAAQIRYTIIVVISCQQAIQMRVHPTHTGGPANHFFFFLTIVTHAPGVTSGLKIRTCFDS